tara:strand:+ start:1505 stop:2542 length:1038 start_codon:yes stop_codon:yes gene_type:complete
MELLIPCAGKSTRFPTERPKYLLTMPDGKLMIQHTTESLLPEFDRVLFAILREHDEKFYSSTILKKLFPKCEILILEEVTKGQAETVTKMLEYFDVKSSFLVKDADAYFEISSSYESNKNYISLCNAKKLPNAKLYNKSFADISDQNYILRTSLDIISNYFSCGGYFFSEPVAFVENYKQYEKMQIDGEFFISNIIDVMIDEGHIFHPMECTNYEDLGTYEVWKEYRKTKSSYFFDLDGVVYENGSEFWKPKWGENKIFNEAKEKINDLYNSGNQIILVTSRSEEFRDITVKQLKQDGLQYHKLIMGIFHGTRYLVNDYSKSNPFPTAKAINTKRDSCDFVEQID